MNRNKIPKKEYERILLDRFISNKSIKLNVINIEDGDEPPDFILYQESKNISLEVTRLIHPDLIEKEALQEKIVLQAQALFNQKYNCKLNTLISFKNVEISTKNKRVDVYAKEMFEIVEMIYLPNKNYEFSISTDYDSPVNSYIEHISIQNNNKLDHWQTFGAFKVDTIDLNLIKEKVKEKEVKIISYKRKFDENWLLMSTNFGKKSSTHDFWPIKEEKLNSTFDKVFIHAYMEDSIIQLK